MSKAISKRDYVPYDVYRMLGFSTEIINSCFTSLKSTYYSVENDVRMNTYKFKRGKEVYFPIMEKIVKTETEVSFSSEAPLTYMLMLFGTIPNNHIAFETLQYLKDYTGERIPYEERSFYAPNKTDYSGIDTDNLIQILVGFEDERNFTAVNSIYKLLKERDDVEEDLWRESLSDRLWIAQIVMSIVEPTIENASLIENTDLFQMVVNYMKINYEGAEGVSEFLIESGRIKYLKGKISEKEIKSWEAELDEASSYSL